MLFNIGPDDNEDCLCSRASSNTDKYLG